MKYSAFDILFDAVFVIDKDRIIHYCNEAGANLIGVPLKRIKLGKSLFHEFITLPDTKLFCMPEGTWGRDEPTPWKELSFSSSKGVEGKVQLSIQPDPNTSEEEKRWLIFLHDVALEEALHSKYRSELEKKEKVIEELKVAQAELEKYSKNLEIMVQERTSELNKANNLLNAMVNSLGQGFLVFNRNAIIEETVSKATETLLETRPAGRFIWDVLKIPTAQLANFKQWCSVIFEEFIPFGDLTKLAPKNYAHSQGKHITLEYSPIRDEHKKITGVVLISTDLTKQIEAQKSAERERKFAKMILKLTQNKHHVRIFFKETKEILSGLKREIDQSSRLPNYDYLFRAVHTLKGGASTFNMMDVTEIAHQYESKLSELRKAPESRRREFVPELKTMLTHIEEQVDSFVREYSYLIGSDIYSSDRNIENKLSRLESFSLKLQKIPKFHELYQEFVEEFLMEPLVNSFRHFEDLVQETAQLLKKKVAPIEYHGKDLKVHLDRYNELISTLVHAFRNAIDHGIEPPEERKMIGKNPFGIIAVSFERQGQGQESLLKITISDDGRGIDPAMIRKKLESSGRGAEIKGLTDYDVLQYVFQSGFSSKEEVTMLSGRGVGMDAILAAARHLGGSAHISSMVGQGATLTLTIPEVLEKKKAA